ILLLDRALVPGNPRYKGEELETWFGFSRTARGLDASIADELQRDDEEPPVGGGIVKSGGGGTQGSRDWKDELARCHRRTRIEAQDTRRQFRFLIHSRHSLPPTLGPQNLRLR